MFGTQTLWKSLHHRVRRERRPNPCASRSRGPFPCRRAAMWLALSAATALLAACGGGGGGDTGGGETATVSFTVEFPESAQRALSEGTVADVSSLGVEVRETPFASGALVQSETELTESSPGVWEGTLTGLPADVSLDFRANAYDGLTLTGNVLFNDLVTQTLTVAGPNDITFLMEAVDDGTQPALPAINSVTMPESVAPDSTNNLISFDISHTGPVDFTATVTSGTVSPASGSHDPATGNLELLFDAPSVEGTVTLTLTLSDPAQPEVTVSAEFDITVSSTASASLSVLFGPAITGIDFVRSATALSVGVDTDPATGVTYAWSGTGSFSTLSATTNPVLIDPFSDTDSGEVTVTVTDGNGISASLTWTISAGDFPYTVNFADTASAELTDLFVYDDFSGTSIDPARWTAGEFKLSAASGALTFDLTRPNGAYIPVNTSQTFSGLAADVSNTATGGQFSAEVQGTFYQDTSSRIVSGWVYLQQDGTVGYDFEACDASETCTSVASGTLNTFTPGTIHQIGLLWDGTDQFKAILDGSSTPVDLSATAPFGTTLTPGINDGFHMTLEVDQGDANADTDSTTVVFDDVFLDADGDFLLDSTVYDDFSTASIDRSKWEFGEGERAIDTTAQVLFLDGTSFEPQYQLEFQNPGTFTALSADIAVQNATVLSGSGVTTGLLGSFYDDTQGTVLGLVDLSGTEAAYSLVRVSSSGFTEMVRQPLGPITQGQFHNVHMQWDGSRFAFRLDDDAPVLVDPADHGAAVASATPSFDLKMLQSGFNLNGEGSIHADYDNVRVESTALSSGPAPLVIEGDIASAGTDAAFDTAVEPGTGKLLLAGFTVNANGNTDMFVTRYNTDGTRDTTFGAAGTGIVTFDHPNGTHAEVGTCVEVDSVGRIVVCGSGWDDLGDADESNDVGKVMAWRLNPDGTFDDTFGQDVDGDTVPDGFTAYQVGSGTSFGTANRGTVDPNDNIVIGGFRHTATTDVQEMLLVRFDDTGALDTTFGSSGVVSYHVAGNFDEALDVEADATAIYVAGISGPANPNDLALWKFDTAGNLDTTFNGDGVAIFDSGFDDFSDALVLDGGAVYQAGRSEPTASDHDVKVLKYNASDGTLDTSFGTGGVFTYDGGNGIDDSDALAVDSTGRVLVGGKSANAAGDFDMLVLRLDGAGALDTTFGTGGEVRYDSGTGPHPSGDPEEAEDLAGALVEDSANNILVSGQVFNGVDTDAALWRLAP